MNSLVQIGLTNVLVASALAVLAVTAGKLLRRPAFTHALWLLVLLKLVTPPLIVIPIGLPEDKQTAEPQSLAALKLPLDVIFPPDVPTEPEPEPVLPNTQPGTLTDPVSPPTVDKSGDAPLKKPANKHKKKLDPCVVPTPVLPPAEEPQEIVPALFAGQTNPTRPPGMHETRSWLSLLPQLPWIELGGSLWLMGSVVWFVVAFARIARFQRILGMGKASSSELQREACELAARMGLADCPSVWLVPGTLSPMLWAVFGYPKLLLPAGLLGRLDDVQRQALLVHELAHYRRRDHWVRCLEFLVLGLYWWCPVVWWARRELREAEEECCDSWVIWTLPRATKAYADALVETLDFLSGIRPALPPVASGLGQLDLLRRRLTMIMRGKTQRSLGGLGFLAVLGLGVLLLPTLPSWAQQAAPPEDPQTAGQRTEQKSQDVNKARADLERAMAELEQLKVHLKQLQKDVEIKNSSLLRFKSELKKAEQDVLKKRTEDVVKKKDVVKKDVVMEQKKTDAKVGGGGIAKVGPMNRDQIKKLLESLDGKSRDDQIKILLKQFEQQAKSPAQVRPPAIATVTPTPKTAGIKTTTTVAGTAKAPTPPQPGSPPKGTTMSFTSGGGDTEKRLANLEWKVDQILHEILELRKGGAKGPAPKDKKGKGGDFEPFGAPGFPAGVIGGQGQGGVGGNKMLKKGGDPQPSRDGGSTTGGQASPTLRSLFGGWGDQSGASTTNPKKSQR